MLEIKRLRGQAEEIAPQVLYDCSIYQYSFIMKLLDFLFTCFPFVAGTSLIA